MTTVTSKIISEVYGVSKEDYSIQMMYMPMNSKSFENNNFAEVIATLIPFTLYASVKLASRIISEADSTDEKRI